MKKSLNKKMLVLLLSLLLVATACGRTMGGLNVGERQTMTETVERGDVERAEVHVVMGVGELNVGSQTGRELLDATFTYNVDEWQPEVNYQTRDNVGYLTVVQPDQEGLRVNLGNLNNLVYRWDLNLNAEIPLELDIELGAGENNLDLNGLNITELALDSGAGEVTVGVPDTLSRLDVNMGVGSLDLDLTGEWGQDLEASVRGGVGELGLRLPADVGVRIEVNQGLGDVDTSGLTRDGDYLVNDAYGESDRLLDIEVDGGVGQITLQVVE